MTLRTISRSAVGGYIRLLRLPLNAAVGLRTRNGRTDTSATTLRLDRLEATLRRVAGRTLGDEELVRDADRMLIAADERERAGRLRAEAQRRSERADERLSEREEQAELQRRRAAERAASRKKQADKQRLAERRRIEKIEAQRRRANENGAARREQAIEDRSKRSRLQQLDKEADALAKKQDALAAKSESQRLRSAATKTKAARKRGGS
jgi:hypothetical protein